MQSDSSSQPTKHHGQTRVSYDVIFICVHKVRFIQLLEIHILDMVACVLSLFEICGDHIRAQSAYELAPVLKWRAYCQPKCLLCSVKILVCIHCFQWVLALQDVPASARARVVANAPVGLAVTLDGVLRGRGFMEEHLVFGGVDAEYPARKAEVLLIFDPEDRVDVREWLLEIVAVVAKGQIPFLDLTEGELRRGTVSIRPHIPVELALIGDSGAVFVSYLCLLGSDLVELL